jgi:hypothetical protein
MLAILEIVLEFRTAVAANVSLDYESSIFPCLVWFGVFFLTFGQVAINVRLVAGFAILAHRLLTIVVR